MHFLPVKKASVVSHEPAVCDVGLSKSTLSNTLYTKDCSQGVRLQGELGCSMNDLAKILVWCHGSESTLDSDQFNSNPLKYYQFIQVKDYILNIYDESDTGHALYLLLNTTKGYAQKLIASCVMLSPDQALNEVLQLLHKTFGSPQVAVRAL